MSIEPLPWRDSWSSRTYLIHLEAFLDQKDVFMTWALDWILFFAAQFIRTGWKNVMTTSYSDVHTWMWGENPIQFKFYQPRSLLMIHLVFGTVFFITCLLQRFLIHIKGPSTDDMASGFYVVHRWLGRVCLIASLISALVALPMCFKAMYGTVVLYLPWTLVWVITTVQVWRTARQKRFNEHRQWANLLVQISLLFITARAVIIGLRWLGWSSVYAYRWGVFSSGMIAKGYLVYRWSLERQLGPHKRK